MTYTKSGLAATVLCITALLILPTTLPAQITFERTYGGAEVDGGRAVQQTVDGGYVIAGYTRSFGAGWNDVYLIRTDARGDTLWTRTYGGAHGDGGCLVERAPGDGYAIIGSTSSYGAGEEDFYLVETDLDGDTSWTKTFGGARSDLGQSAQQTSDGGYVVAGHTYSFGAGGSDIYLIKTRANGDTLWTSTFGGESEDYGFAVEQTTDSGFFIAGSSCRYDSVEFDLCVIKTDADGDTLWTRTFGGPEEDCGFSAQQTNDGGYVVAGYTYSYGVGGDAFLVKIDAYGDSVWSRTFGGTLYDEASSVRQTTDGGYIIAGTTQSFGAGGYDVWLVKTDADGEALWTRTFGGPDNDRAFSVQQTSDGGYVVAGHTYSYGAGNSDVYLIKTDSLGRVGIEEPETPPTRAPSFSLSCTPNPASGSVTISLSPSIPLSLSPVLRLFDAQGRLVLSQPVRASSFTLHPSSLPAGVYVARLDFGTRHASSRLVLQR
jgi:hypothetical protein